MSRFARERTDNGACADRAPPSMRPRVVALLLLGASLAAPSPARAWVCSRALDNDNREVGPSLAWTTRTVPYSVAAAGTADLPGDTEQAVIDDAFAVWEGVSECAAPHRVTDLQFVRVARTEERDLIGYDYLDPPSNENLLIFRDTGWPHHGRIIALTTTTFSAQTGEIFDADIEFNSAGFEFRDLDPCCPDCSPPSLPASSCAFTDLMNTAVHEIGHIVGLGHPDDWPEIDPHCVDDSTMCATAELGDTNKRSLACDDRDGLVFKYPAGAANGYCAQPACAAGDDACGSCNAAACANWQACGFCGPPLPLGKDVAIRAVGFNDGLDGGCACRGAPGGFWMALAGGALLCLRRRRTS